MLGRNDVLWTLSILLFDFATCYVDKPLILTPYLKEGKIKEAQEKSLVSPDINGVKGYTGFFTVDKDCGSNLFFWFLPAENNWEKAPVLLWVPASAGTSALMGFFMDIGPFNRNRKEGFIKREYHWTKNNNVLFLDQPVGNGFSYMEKKCKTDNLDKISKDAYEALVQFFMLFPKLQPNKFFIVGVSFVGHYGPGIATEIHHCNQNATVKINLVGLIMGDPYIDLRCHHAAAYEYELGIIDEKIRDQMLKFEKNLTLHIDAKNYTGVADVAEDTPYGDDGIPAYSNVLLDNFTDIDFETYIRDYKVRERIHVGSTPYNLYQTLDAERPSLYIPTNSYIEELLKAGKYILGFYMGQLDVYNPSTAIPCVLRQLKWPGAETYKAANRTQWYVDQRLAGWFKVAANVFEVVVRDSGLYTMRDQPRATYELVSAALADSPGEKLLSKLKTEPSSDATSK